MKRITILFVGIAAIVLSGCEKDKGSQLTGPQEITIMAQVPSHIQTKSELDGLKVLWNAGDKILVVDSQNSQHEFTAENAGTVSKFTGLSDDPAGVHYGFYPFQFAEWGGSKFSSRIPSNQYVGGPEGFMPRASNTPWDPSATIAVGASTTDDSIMPFYNAHALIKVIFPTIPDNFTVKNITLMSNNDADMIAGNVDVSLPTTSLPSTPSAVTLPTVTLTGNLASTVALNNDGGFQSGATVYIAAFPTSLHGITALFSGVGRISGVSVDIPLFSYITSAGTDKLTEVPLYQNRIRVLDFSAMSIPDLGAEYHIHPKDPDEGQYLSVSAFGTAIYTAYGTQSGHGDRFEAEIWDATLDHTITYTSYAQIKFVSLKDDHIRPYQYTVHIGDQSKDDDNECGYLGFSTEKQAFYILPGTRDRALEANSGNITYSWYRNHTVPAYAIQYTFFALD